VFAPGQASLVGFIGGIVLVASQVFLERKLKLDDAVGAVSVHGVCGIWGTLAIGFMAPLDTLAAGGRAEQILVQAVGAGTAFLWTFPLSLAVFWLIKKTIGLRVDPEEEIVGLNVSEHGATIALVDTISAMREIAAARGDLTRTIPVRHGEDTAQLNEAFNQMIESLNELVSAVKEETSRFIAASGLMLEQTRLIVQSIGENHESIVQMNAGLQEVQAVIESGNEREDRFIDTIRSSVQSFREYARRMEEMKETGKRVSEWMEAIRAEKDETSSLNKLMFSPFFPLFRMISSLTSKAPLDRI
jgi:Amt family ammonium transporter